MFTSKSGEWNRTKQKLIHNNAPKGHPIEALKGRNKVTQGTALGSSPGKQPWEAARKKPREAAWKKLN
jgi:hypothetical protein